MVLARDRCALVAVWRADPFCTRRRCAGHCPVDRCVCVGIWNLYAGPGIPAQRSPAALSATNIAAAGYRLPGVNPQERITNLLRMTKLSTIFAILADEPAA